ncbi:uncharacterized protein LOC105278707 isoform X2 [Ooceraea biroi]|uniref:uncharacterized protein LOC105278707 isoform X2 n=1 Tax=Ooceraea biroi TaxID=2015173 RepID=UPI000F08C61B|nr:uncharacterized protein LOC105278707 isoform X2 [Ooceraea biroi]
MDISSMLEVQVKEMKTEVDVKEDDDFNEQMMAGTRDFGSTTSGRATSTTSTAVAAISQEESSFYKLLFNERFNDIASVRFCRIHCTACNVHIGSAPAQIHNMFEHPMLHTLLCAKCREFYGNGTFEQGDDATDMFCRWCANGGNLYCCSYCSNTFCYKCIKRNFSSLIRKKIEADEKWKCFVCNPRDLYSARAMCWALLQHVQTVTRILKNDKNMSAKEMEEKMNLDESQCCTRRSKRRCRKAESNSEEEDETYFPKKLNGLSVNIKRKTKKIKSYSKYSNGTKRYMQSLVTPMPIRPRPALSMSMQTFTQTELPQSRVEHEKQIVKASESIVLPSPSVINTETTSRYSDSGIQPTFYQTFVNNTAGSSTYVQVSSAVKPATHQVSSAVKSTTHQVSSAVKPTTHHQIALSSLSSQPTSYQPSQLSQPQPPPPPNAMVSIPSPGKKRARPRLLVPGSKRSNLMLTPNIIDLDSDSDDDLRIVEQQNDSVDVDVNDKVVPVALTWENSDDDDVREQQPLRQMSASAGKDSSSFNAVMLRHRQDLDKILSDIVKKKVYLFCNLSNTTQDVELAIQEKVKNFCRCMHNTVLQLTGVNDRVVREYNGWIKSRRTIPDTPSSVDENASVIQENVEIPLDMTCVNDSEAESDSEKLSDHRIKKASDLVKNNTIILKDILFFKKDVVNRGVGTKLLYADKAIQVCDVAPCDYEKCIDYSVLNTADYGSETNDHDDDAETPKTNDDGGISKTSDDSGISKTKVEPQKTFGTYEEQFIYYLQYIEDHGIQIEDTEELTNPDETPSQELSVTSPFSFEDLDPDDESTGEQTKNNVQERNAENCVNSLLEDKKIDVPTNAVHKEITNESSNESNIDIKVAENKLQETNNHPTEEEAISTVSNNKDASSSQNSKDAISIETVASTENEECSIIDN